MKQMLLSFLLCSVMLFSSTLRVPADYSTIQSAINASAHGDTVLVSPGRYYENIIFGGKNITVASLFLTTGNLQYISATIIDGSTPAHADSASCVRIVNGETREAKLIGFTLTKGKGTRWLDEHGAGYYYEGGGILITLASPQIGFNIITDNEAIRRTSGTQSAGGGGIRIGDGSPLIFNNIIMYNRGMYGGGIVSNYADPVIRNNIIAHNRVYQAVANAATFGGGGVWMLGTNTRVFLENNTIVYNSAAGGGSQTAGRGGGILAWGTAASVRNNIVYGNTQSSGSQFYMLNFSDSVVYNLVQGGVSGLGNINVLPLMDSLTFVLNSLSPCIDAGDTAAVYNDRENPAQPGLALFPSLSTVRNDMGAFGGPGARQLADIPVSTKEQTSSAPPAEFVLKANYPNPFNPVTTIRYTIPAAGVVKVSVYNVLGNLVSVAVEEFKQPGEYEFKYNASALPSGTYFYELTSGSHRSIKKMILLK